MTLLKDLLARQLRIVSVPPTATVLDAAKAMGEANCGSTIVMDGKRPAGIFTERDLMTRVLLQSLDVDQVRVADVMTTDLVVAKPGDSIGAAILLMHKHHIRHLPVMGKGGDRTDHRENPRVVAVIALQPPKGDNKPGLNAVPVGGLFQQRPVFRHHLPALANSRRIDRVIEVFPECKCEFRLPAIEFDNPFDGLDPGQRGVEKRPRYTSGDGFVPHAFEPLGKRLGRFARRHGANGPDEAKEKGNRRQQTFESGFRTNHRPFASATPLRQRQASLLISP